VLPQAFWLEDYHLVCRADGADSNLFIIQLLPIYLADTYRACLDHLPKNWINCWEDLKETFTNNFQGTYIWPDNPWDLKGCRQKQGESLWHYIRWFSQKCHELSEICDIDVISVFWSGMTCRTLVHELIHQQLKTIKELIDIATTHASGEEAVRAVFMQNSGKATVGGRRGASNTAADKGTKRSTKTDKRGPR
jgi:hypothetical protein